jgi:hypothetical protein
MTRQRIDTVKLRIRSRFISSRHLKPALVVATLGLILVAVDGGPAVAGTYSVHQCNYEQAISTNSFSWQGSGVPGLLQHANSGCAEFGLAARTSGIGTSQTYLDGAAGGYVASAPTGTAFTRFSGIFGTLTNCCVTGMEAFAEAQEFAVGAGDRDEIFRGSLGSSTWPPPSGSQGPVRRDWSADEAGFNAERIGYFLGCANPSGCSQSVTGDHRVRGRSFEFTLEDQHDPELAEPEGSLLSGGWVRGVRSFTVAAEDLGGGLAGVFASIDSTEVVESLSSCSKIAGRYVELRPCPLVRNGTWAVDTRNFNDGSAMLRVSANDVGGRGAERLHPVKIDNTPPVAPVGLALSGSQGWRSVNDFVVGWDAPSGEYAPISTVHYEICSSGGSCEAGARAGSGVSMIQVDVPQPGDYDLRVWFEDLAGNVESNNASDIDLKFDDGIPGVAQIAVPNGWLGDALADSPAVSLDVEGDSEPISGIAGYSITTDGSHPDGSLEVSGRTPAYVLGGLPEGLTPVRAVAVSGAGLVAASAGTALVKIDRSAPSTSATGIPDADMWHARSVTAKITSSDQPGLAGVEPAPQDHPIAEGGYLMLHIDGGSAKEIRGDRVAVDVTTDGHHTLTYRAFDAAGNGSVEKEVGFKIDQTGPVGAFRALDPGDPRALRVDVSDATSGIGDGAIEYRREGVGGFKRLATTRAGGVLTARVDDQALPAGRYEVRAVVTDVAGNEAVIDSWADGSSATLSMPLRLSANVDVAGVVKAKGCAKASKRRRKGGRKRTVNRKKKCRRKQQKTATTLMLGYGKRAPSTGTLTTEQGAAIANAPIVVEGQRRAGGPFAQLGTTRTDAQGKFRFTVPAGPSRTVRYRYDGTNTVRPAVDQIVTKVRAAARLKVDRRRLRNGQAVRFTGRLLGKPIPAAGKLVALQAKVGREWRTFATPRANAKGVFKHRYRFTVTTGLRRYAFRAVVAREAAYSYEAGVSKTVKVTVRGR